MTLGYLYATVCIMDFSNKTSMGWYPKRNQETSETKFIGQASMAIVIFDIASEKFDDMESHFQYLRTVVWKQYQFEEYLIDLAATELCNGYDARKLLNFISWTLVMSYFFYKEGQLNFPQSALEIIADTLDYFIRSGEFCEHTDWTELLEDIQCKRNEEKLKNMVFYNKSHELNVASLPRKKRPRRLAERGVRGSDRS